MHTYIIERLIFLSRSLHKGFRSGKDFENTSTLYMYVYYVSFPNFLPLSGGLFLPICMDDGGNGVGEDLSFLEE